MKITNCKVNHINAPMGFTLDNPVFSWNVTECEDVDSTLYTRIVVREHGQDIVLMDWTKLEYFHTALKLDLKSRTVYEWQIRVRNDAGEEAEAVHFFETGKMDEAWQAKWITCDKAKDYQVVGACSADRRERLPVFEKNFDLNPQEKIERARLYICGLGLYEAYLNGQRVGDEYLAPGCTVYDQYAQSYTYDVTKLLEKTDGQNGKEGAKRANGGSQTLSVLMGDGWYKGRYDFEKFTEPFYGNRFLLIAELHIDYESGRTKVVCTDESWNVKRSRILFSGIYDGEIVDDTLGELPEEEVIVCEGKEGDNVTSGQGNGFRLPKLRDRLSLPVKTHEEWVPKLLFTPKEEAVLDIGQNLAGIFELRVKEPKGSKIHLQFGEVLQDGCFYRENLRTARAEYIYISDGNEHVLRPHFTFYGFRYVKVSGIRELKASDFKAYAIYSDLDFTGTLVTGNEKINRLIQNTVWGMKSNFVDVPTDCPQRDERMGWTGDAQAFSETAGLLADTYAFYRKYLYDMSLEQKKRNGTVPDVIPAFRLNNGSAVWGDATCIIPWNLYVSTGDSSILKEHYEAMVSWVEHIREVDGEDHGWRRVFHYGDWLALDNMHGNAAALKGATDEGFIADVYYRKSVLIVAKTAKLLGKKKDAAKYEKLADQILKDIKKEFYSETGRCCFPTQTAAVLTLLEGLHDRDRALEQLKKCLRDSGGKLTTGFVGTPFLCAILSDNGMEKEAFELLLNEEYPGWLYEVNLGATTIWERWNSLDENGHISSTGMNSLNHYTYGSVTAWLFKYVGGLKLCEEKPGYRYVEIRPLINWKLRFVRLRYPSAYGTYEVEWKIKDPTHLSVRVTVPYQAQARVILPVTHKEHLLKAGEYSFDYEIDSPVVRIYSSGDTMRDLMADPDTRSVVREQVANAEHILGFSADRPLEETLRNLGYEEEKLRTLDAKLRKVSLGALSF